MKFEIDDNLDLKTARKYIEKSYDLERTYENTHGQYSFLNPGYKIREKIVEMDILESEDYIKMLFANKNTDYFDFIVAITILNKLGNDFGIDNENLLEYTKYILTNKSYIAYSDESTKNRQIKFGEHIKSDILEIVFDKSKTLDNLNIKDLQKIVNTYGTKENIELMNKILFPKLNKGSIDELIQGLNEFKDTPINEKELNELLNLKNMDLLTAISKNITLSDEQFIKVFESAKNIERDSIYNSNTIKDVYENLLEKDIEQLNNFLTFELTYDKFDDKKLDEKIKYIFDCKYKRMSDDSSIYWAISRELLNKNPSTLNECNEIIKSYIENVEFKDMDNETRSFSYNL